MFVEVLKKHAKIRLQELHTARNSKPRYSLEDLCFKQQIDFIKSPARFKNARCSRRAGKTTGIGHLFREVSLIKPGYDCLYIAKSRIMAKRILWKILIDILYEQKDDYKVYEAELYIKMRSTGNCIFLEGANDRHRIEKLRGRKFKVVVIDEAQTFPSYITYMIDEILEPSVADLQGSIIAAGTPNPACAGWFYDIDHSDGWEHHYWTWHDNRFFIESAMAENPALTCPDDILTAACKRRGIEISHPSIQREWFGRWVKSDDLQVYKYDEDKCDYDELPPANDWRYVLGGDLGFNDSDALTMWAFSESYREAYVVEQFKKSKMTISEFAGHAKRFQEKYKPFAEVIDAGALGKKIQEELNTRFGFYFIAAEKDRKPEFIELMNDDLRQGYIKIKRNTPLAQEMKILCWDDEIFREQHKFVEDAYFDNHSCDSALYPWRFIYNYRHEKPKKKIEHNTNEYADYLLEKSIEKIQSARENSNDFERDYFERDNSF